MNEEDPTPDQLEMEKEELQQESIIVVLGALHANLQHLWQFKVRQQLSFSRIEYRMGDARTLKIDAEQDFKHMRSQRESELISKIEQMKMHAATLAQSLHDEQTKCMTAKEE